MVYRSDRLYQPAALLIGLGSPCSPSSISGDLDRDSTAGFLTVIAIIIAMNICRWVFMLHELKYIFWHFILAVCIRCSTLIVYNFIEYTLFVFLFEWKQQNLSLKSEIFTDNSRKKNYQANIFSYKRSLNFMYYTTLLEHILQ